MSRRISQSGVVFAVLLALLCLLPSSARAIYYWDGNGSATGAGTAPSGSWDTTSANWSNNGSSDDGTGTPAVYSQDSNVAFSNGSDATGSYTITVSGATQIIVHDMHFDDGTVTIVGKSLFLDGTNHISVLPGHVATINVTLANGAAITDAIHKYKMGTLILGGTNVYNGDTTIEGGVLQIGGNGSLPGTTRVILGNGGTDGFTDTPPTLATGGFSQTLGPLAMSGPTPTLPRTIDFGNGNSILQFADSHAQDWSTDILTITNFTLGIDKLRFGSDQNGVTSTQLAQMQFADFANAPGVIDSAGYVLPNLPKFLSVQLAGQPPQLQLQWSAVDNRSYLLESRPDFSTGWGTVGTYAGSGGVASATDNPSTKAKFYRVTLLP